MLPCSQIRRTKWIGLASRTHRTERPVKASFADAANVGYRTAARRNAKIASNESRLKKFFLNLFWVRQGRAARASLHQRM
jgi:hypothetical protein